MQLIEGSGAGTAAADETELAALAMLRPGARHGAALGSIKANIGNTRAAAGAAGLIKTVLAHEHRHHPAVDRVRPAASAAARPVTPGCGCPHAPRPGPMASGIAGVSAMGRRA